MCTQGRGQPGRPLPWGAPDIPHLPGREQLKEAMGKDCVAPPAPEAHSELQAGSARTQPVGIGCQCDLKHGLLSSEA